MIIGQSRWPILGMAAVLGVLAQGWAARAQETPPPAAALLFDEPQLAATAPGEVIDYAYRRMSADPARFGASFEDRLKLSIDKGKSPDSRTISVEMFSGVNQKPAGPFSDMTGNPLLVLILENNVQQLSAELQASPRYLKNVIRSALRDKASVAPDAISADGTMLPGWRVSITPFEDDPNRARMKGLETMTYVFRVAKALPGEIGQIDIAARNQSGTTLFEETVDYVKANH